MKKLAYGLVLA